jgi:hypothetical protein
MKDKKMTTKRYYKLYIKECDIVITDHELYSIEISTMKDNDKKRFFYLMSMFVEEHGQEEFMYVYWKIVNEIYNKTNKSGYPDNLSYLFENVAPVEAVMQQYKIRTFRFENPEYKIIVTYNPDKKGYYFHYPRSCIYYYIGCGDPDEGPLSSDNIIY